MLPPLDALSVAAAVVQFVDFGAEIISTAREICESAAGDTVRNVTLNITVSAFDDVSRTLAASSSDSIQTQYPTLFRLVTTSQSLSADLLALLKKIKAKNSHSKWQAFAAAIRAKLKEGETNGLAKRLDERKTQISLELQWLTR